MITPLTAHPTAPRTIPKINAVTFAFRAKIIVPSMEMSELEVRGISFAWRTGHRITSRSPLVKRKAVEWLLEEGSNLRLLKERVEGKREARYILTRRTLYVIAEKYPELAHTVNLVIRKRFNPAGRPPVCIPEGIEALMAEASSESEMRNETQEEADLRLLNLILDSRTDYTRLVHDNSRDRFRRKTKTVTEEERNLVAARCYKAIGFCFPDLYDSAMAQAAVLAPEIVVDRLPSTKPLPAPQKAQ